MTEIIDPSQEETRITTKEIFMSRKGCPVSLDYLLFACMQSEKFLKSNSTTETLGIFPADEIRATSKADVERNAVAIFEWYRKNVEALGIETVVDIERIGEVSAAFVQILADIQTVCSKAGVNLKANWGLKTPDDMREIIVHTSQVHLAFFHELFMKYLDWMFRREDTTVYEVGDRPPVGRYAPRLPRRGKDGPPSRGGGPRGGSSDSRPPRRDGRGGSDRGGERPPRGGNRGGDRPERSERGPRPDRDGGGRPPRKSFDGPRPERGPRPDRGDRGPRRPQRDEGEATEILKPSVMSAIENLMNQSLNRIALPPDNSFNRRVQHSIANAEGFKTESEGDEPNRHVVILAKN